MGDERGRTPSAMLEGKRRRVGKGGEKGGSPSVDEESSEAPEDEEEDVDWEVDPWAGSWADFAPVWEQASSRKESRAHSRSGHISVDGCWSGIVSTVVRMGQRVMGKERIL